MFFLFSVKSAFSTLALLVLLCFSSQAQLVNIEKVRKDKKEGFQGAVGVTLSLTQNTKQIFQANNQTHLQYHKNAHTILAINNIGYMRVEGDNLINNGFQHLRYNYDLIPDLLTLEALTQHQYNSIRLLQRRFLLGGGPRFKVFENENFRLFLAPLAIYENELFSDEEQTRTSKLKGNLYLSAGIDLNEQLNFSHTTYYQPDLAAFSEFRLASETSLNFKISENFSFEAVFDLAYDSHPLEDIPKLFYTLRNGITYSF